MVPKFAPRRVPSLDADEENRYARQIVLQDIGWEGQRRLKGSTALVAGAGGLGSPILMQLTAMGVGRIKVIDRDIVSATDLHRQYLYGTGDVGRPKVEAAEERLKEINPGVVMEPYAETLSSQRLLSLLEGVDVILDGLDGMKARYALNRASHRLSVPYVFSSAVEMFGNVSTILPGRTPCLECFFGGLGEEAVPKCAVVGVHPSVLGIVASVAVSEAVKVMTGAKLALASKLLFADLRSFSFDLIALSRNEACPVCGSGRGASDATLDLVERACARDGSGTYFVNPRKMMSFDLGALRSFSKRRGWRLLGGGKLARTMQVDEVLDVTIFKSGVGLFRVKKPVTSFGEIEGRIRDVFKDVVVNAYGVPWEEYSEGSSPRGRSPAEDE